MAVTVGLVARVKINFADSKRPAPVWSRREAGLGTDPRPSWTLAFKASP